MDNLADDGNINYQVGLDVDSANAELVKLRSQINGTTANLQQTQQVIQNAVTRMTADITKSMQSAKMNADQLLATMRRLERVQGNTITNASRGTLGNQTLGAAGTLLSNEARNSIENVTARLTNELVSQYTQRLRAMDQQVEARIRQARFQSDRLLANTAPDVLSARQTLAERTNQNQIRRAEMGDARYGMANTIERISSNGGADIITVQARLIAGYAALNLAMNGIRDTAQFVVGLDKEFRQFQAITATTNFEMIGLKDSLIEVSEASKFTALEIAEAATTMGQAGLSAREVADTIGSVAELATAAGSSLSESVDVVTSTMSIFNLQTSQAADVANTLTAALNLSKLSMDKLVLGFQYAGNTAAQMGVTYQELTGVLGALANSGIRSGSTLGTGLRQLLIDIQNPSKELTSVLKQLGLTQEDINVESNGLINVLETLKDSGFGAAQAFGAFETRAAAAYVALANNTDLAVELQNQFVLSSAAADANAIQMESLSNTYAKFQSVVGTVAYNAFEPLLAALQDTLNWFADLIATLNKIPGVLQVATIAFTALATAIALSSASALFRGLAGAIPLFAQLGTAAASAGAGVGLLNVALSINPFVLLASIVAAGAVAFYTFGNNAADAADRIDALKGQINTLAGETDSANAQVEAINQTITNLIKQKQALDSDPLMRTSKILEVKQAFKEIGDEVNTTTGTVDDLIEALNRLADADLSRVGAGLRETIAANDALIAEYRAQLQQTKVQGMSSLYEPAGSYANLDPLGFMRTKDDPKVQQAFIEGLFGQSFGQDFSKYADMVFNPSQFPSDVSSSQVIESDISRKISETSTRRTILESRQAGGLTLSQAELDELARIPDYLILLETLREQIRPLVAANLNIANAESQNKILEADRLKNDADKLLMSSGVTRDIQILQEDINNQYTAIRQNAGNLDAAGLKQAYEALDQQFATKILTLTAQANAVVNQLVTQSGGTVSQQDAKSVVAAATTDLAGLQAQISTQAKNSNIAYQAVVEEQLETDLKEVDDQIQLQLSGRTRALTAATLDDISDYIRDKFDQKRDITDALFGARIAQEEDQDSKDQLARELRAAQNEISRSEQEAMAKLSDDRQDLQVDILEEQKRVLDEEVKVMQTKLNTLVAQIAKASPGPVMDALIAQWQQVAMAQNALLSQSNGLGIQIGSFGTNARPLNTQQGMRGNEAMKVLMSLGYSQAQAAGIAGNLMAESNINPMAIGDRGQAFGIGQWHPDRQALLKQFAADNNYDYKSTDAQLRFIDWEMKNSPATAGADTYGTLMAQTTPQGAADVFRRLYERPSADPRLGQHDARVGYAMTLAGGYSTQAANDTGNLTDLAGGIQTGTTKATNEAVNAAVTAATQQIQTLMTQAGITNNPETVKGMIVSVEELYNKIIEEKTRQFDQENAAEIAAGDPETAQNRETLISGLKADQNQKMSQMLETYWRALDEKIQEPLEDAKAALEEAKRPENAGKYTQADFLNLENNVRLAERKVLVDQLNASQAVLAETQARLAETEPGSAESNYWLLEEARALEVVNELTRAKNAADAATAQQGPSVAAAIDSATKAWAMQNGILDELGNQIPLAKQVENAWGGVLDTLTTGFSTLFVDLAKGTMTAEEAFKKFALSVIDSFMQMIAKALAMQVVMGLMGGESGGGSGSNWLGTLLGVVAPAANGYIKGAAFGEVVGGFSNRDSELRRVMPGEVILRRSAVGAIGADALAKINDLGARTISEGISPEMPANDNSGLGGMVNVWVVSPDQVPPLGPKDIIATVASDIQRRGPIKQLIQQVQMGGI